MTEVNKTIAMTPLFKKLNYKPGTAILVINAPKEFEDELKQMRAFSAIITSDKLVDAVEFALIFVTRKIEIEEHITSIYPKLKGDAVVWFCYPKGTSKHYKCDFNRDNGWDAIRKYHLESVRMVAIDEDWSALRFRNTAYIKNFKS